MSYYFVANINIKNQNEYQKYLNEVDSVFDKFNGQYIALDNDPEILEGSWDYTRTVIIQFETKNDFEEWYRSDDYQRILKHRLAGADCDTLLIKGK